MWWRGERAGGAFIGAWVAWDMCGNRVEYARLGKLDLGSPTALVLDLFVD